MAAPSAKNRYSALLQRQRAYFDAGSTRSPASRLAALRALQGALKEFDPALMAALKKDMGKPEIEAYTGELLLVCKEVKYALRRLRGWMRPRRVPTPLFHQPAASRIVPEPCGTVLIIAPWNYPVQLLFAPLVSALAAGNTVVLKPSELAPATARVVRQLVRRTFPPELVSVVSGGVAETTELLANPFDMIFYTGSGTVGRVVMRAAAEHLTPVVLELGGKCPCIVDRTADLMASARRIVWGKFYNAGQTCVAPDYLLVHRDVRESFLRKLDQAIGDFYGGDARRSPDYARIINARHFDRLCALLPDRVRSGGATNRKERYIAPTIVDDAGWESPLMREEIFGPILPVLEYTELDAVLREIRRRPTPLALYLFTRDRHLKRRVIAETASGGICINDVIRHLSTVHLPFGGAGESGMGRYHGEAGFRAFSREKSVMSRHLRPGSRILFPPYGKKLDWIRWLARFF